MYKLSEYGVTLTTEDGAVLSIPNAEGNRHWVEFQEWLAEGNTPEPQYTEEELVAKQNAEAVAAAMQTLASTDWIVVKIAEAQMAGEDIAPLQEKYVEELLARAAARETINTVGV